MHPELKASVEKFLTDNVEEFKRLTRRAASIAAEGSTLSSFEMENFSKANDRADASMLVQSAMKETDDLNRLIQKLEHLMDTLLQQKDPSPVRAKTLNDVLRVLRLEQKSLAKA